MIDIHVLVRNRCGIEPLGVFFPFSNEALARSVLSVPFLCIQDLVLLRQTD